MTNGNGSRPPVSIVSGLTIAFGEDAALPIASGTIVRGLLYAGSTTLFYGAPKSGKSFLATDCALSIADDNCNEWLGMPIVRHGAVLYVACEGHAGYWKRFRAAKAHRAITLPDNLILATGRPSLITFDKGQHCFVPSPEDIIEAANHCGRAGHPPLVVVIDTVFKAFGRGNVNQSMDMNAFLAAIDAITAYGVAVLLVHHGAKSRDTPVGSVAMPGGTDTVVLVSRDKDTGERTWCVEMAKDDMETEPRVFDLKVVDVGIDPDGFEVTSCVVEDKAPAAAQPKAAKNQGGRPKKTAPIDLQLAILKEVIGKKGKKINGLNGAQEMAVEVGQWRDEIFLRTEPGLSPNSKRTAFRRDINRLQSTGKIAVLQDFVWVI